MKSLLLILALLTAPLAFTACSTAPTERVSQVRTLQAIGETASTSMQVAAKLRVQGRISAEQWTRIADFHDTRYLPAYRLAVATVSADLSSVASPDLINLVTQLAALVAELEKKP